jgi:hypothetical protein
MDRLNGGTHDDPDTALQETEAEVERTRERLNASLGALREEISDLADWRSWVNKQPMAFMAGAFTLGLLFGLATSGRGR